VIAALVILGLVCLAQLVLVVFVLTTRRDDGTQLGELIALADRMAQRLQAPQAAVAAAASEITDPSTYAPPALIPDDDDAFWESREGLAQRLAAEEAAEAS
jgi:hypothetical protein